MTISSEGIQMQSRSEYVNQHPRVVAVENRVARIREQMRDACRWGETRRFAGRSAGIRLANLERAISWRSKMWDKANAEFDSCVARQATTTPSLPLYCPDQKERGEGVFFKSNRPSMAAVKPPRAIGRR